MIEVNKILNENCLTGLKNLPDNSIDCCVTSPPYYGLRDYGTEDQIGLEESPEEFVSKLVEVFTEVKRVLKPEGTLWLNLGDSYANPSKPGGGDPTIGKRNIGTSNYRSNMPEGLKPKDLIGIPWMVAFALRSSGWYLRQDIIWHKPNPMPESVTDRCTKSHEYIFLMSKSPKYYYDSASIKEYASYNTHERVSRAALNHKSNPNEKQNGIRPRKIANVGEGIKNNESFDKAMFKMPEKRNKRSVWSIVTQAFPQAHFATFLEDLIVDCIKAGCPEDGIVLDPFMGAGTTALVARKLLRNYIGFELNPEYIKIAEKRLQTQLGMFL